MKYACIVAFLLVSLVARSQVYFKYDYRDCEPADLCMYCGDEVARPTVNLSKYLQRELDRNMFEYDGQGRKIMYQVYIDSDGKLCVISADNHFGNRMLRNDMRAVLNHMPNWKPAYKDGKPIGSGIIIEFTFYRDYFDVRYISRPRKVDGRVI